MTTSEAVLEHTSPKYIGALPGGKEALFALNPSVNPYLYEFPLVFDSFQSKRHIVRGFYFGSRPAMIRSEVEDFGTTRTLLIVERHASNPRYHAARTIISLAEGVLPEIESRLVGHSNEFDHGKVLSRDPDNVVIGAHPLNADDHLKLTNFTRLAKSAA